MTGKSKLSMEGEELVAAAAAAAAPVHGHAQQQHQSKVMRTDQFPVRVPTGPTLGPDQSSSTSIRPSGAATDLYLYGGAPAPATPPATTATTTTSTPTIPTSPIAAAAAALQPFPSPPSPFPATFESPGMAAATAAAATFRFPFTTAQWQELERQAMIYKYMMAAVPIPPDLLLPSKSCYHDSSPPLGRGSMFNLRFSNSVDPEPGRCRRTDGKKWRCSRDVASDQKYCERHMHRGRPRSRKHVEVQARAAQPVPSTTTATTTTTTGSNPQLQSFPATQSSFLTAKNPFFTHVVQQPRYVDWMNGAGWQFAEQEVVARMRPCYEDSLSLNFSGFGGGSSGGREQSDQCCIFLNSDLSSVEDPLQKEPPLHFIDAWSITTAAESTTTTTTTSVIAGSEAEISAECKFPMSSLTLSMPSCEEEEHVDMGLGVPESDRERVNGEKHAALSWASAPMPLLGGPLGEVLQSTASAGSNSLSPHSCGSLNLMVEPCVEGCTTTTHDSPTGVLHRTLASLSDSCGCSSPTFAAGQFAFLN